MTTLATKVELLIQGIEDSADRRVYIFSVDSTVESMAFVIFARERKYPFTAIKVITG